MKKALPPEWPSFEGGVRIWADDWAIVGPSGLVVCPEDRGCWSGHVVCEDGKWLLRFRSCFPDHKVEVRPYIETEGFQDKMEAEIERLRQSAAEILRKAERLEDLLKTVDSWETVGAPTSTSS
jgi:hypothetical protein